MKKTAAFISVLLLTVLGASAQTGAVTNAILYHKDGELDRAKEQIDKAIEDVKTGAAAKTWYYRGMIYTDILITKNDKYKTLSSDPELVAQQSFQKAIELDGASKGEYYQLSEKKLSELWGEVVNKGIAAYEAGDYTNAIKNYEVGMKIKPADTTAYIYGIYAAEETHNNALIKQYLTKLESTGYKSPYLYRKQIQIAEQDEKNTAKALEAANKGIAAYPGNQELLFDRVILYTNMAQYKNALTDIQVLVQKNPLNIDYLTFAGSLSQKQGESENAINYYNTVLKQEPKNFAANYNMAVIYYNKGKEILDQVGAIHDFHKRQTEGKVKEQEAEGELNKSYSYAKIAYETKEEADKKDARELMTKINKALNRPDNTEQNLH